MGETWQEKSMSDEDKLYEESVNRIRSGIKQSLSFKQASELINVEEKALREAIIRDALKVFIAEMHFSGGKSIEEVAQTLKLPVEGIKRARSEMLKEVEASAIEAYKLSIGQKGEA